MSETPSKTVQPQKVIVVVEDEKPLLEAIRIKLEKSGFTVITARTVTEAKKQIESYEHVAAIWLDHYLMGKENGLDFLAWCKEHKNARCRAIPIFAVSNTASADKVPVYLKMGAKQFFVKSNHRLDHIIAEIEKEID